MLHAAEVNIGRQRFFEEADSFVSETSIEKLISATTP